MWIWTASGSNSALIRMKPGVTAAGCKRRRKAAAGLLAVGFAI
jgi:hypothetical protein